MDAEYKYTVRDYQWDKGCRHGYYKATGSLLSKINYVFTCEVTGVSCNDPSHLIDIEISYNEIVSTLKVCSDVYIYRFGNLP